MGLLTICFGERRKLFGTEDMGPTSTLCFFFKTLQNQIEYKTIAMQLKQIIQKILKNTKKKRL
jgi:hypothetical protein